MPLHKKFIFVLLIFVSLSAEENCPFCDPEILDKQEVYRSNYWRILLDYKPVLKGHLLIVPIEHRLTRHELSREEHDELYDIERRIHCAFLRLYGEDSEDFQYEKNGPTLQSVHHFHIHVLPIDSKMRSAWQKIRLFSKLFLFPPSPITTEEIQQQKCELQSLFQNCN